MISPIGLGVYLLLLSVLTIGSCVSPPVAIAALGCLFGLKQLGEASHSWLAANAVATNFAVAMIACVAIIRRLFQGRLLTSGVPPLFGVTLLFYTYMLVSLAWTPAYGPAINLWAHDYPYIVLLVGIAPWLAATNEELQTAFSWFAGVGGILVLTLMFALRWGDRGLIVSAGSIIDETNPLAIADVAGAVAICALFIVPSQWRLAGSVIRLIFAAVSIITIIRSGSRGQLLATCAAIALMVPVAYPLSRLRGAGNALIGIAAVFFGVAWGVGSYIHWYDDRWAQGQEVGDVAGRWAMVSALLHAWSHDLTAVVFGIGNSGSFSPSIAGFYPHNVPLEILGEEGLVGFAMYLALLGITIAWVARGLRSVRESPAKRGLLAAAVGCLIFALITTFKQGNAFGSVTFFLFAMLACRTAQRLSAETDYSKPRPAVRTSSLTGRPIAPNLMK